MGIFAIGIEHPLDMTVQRLHDPDPRQLRVAPAAAQHQRGNLTTSDHAEMWLLRLATTLVAGAVQYVIAAVEVIIRQGMQS